MFKLTFLLLIFLVVVHVPEYSSASHHVTRQNCLAEIKIIEQYCANNRFDLQARDVTVWARDPVKCCRAWKIYHCVSEKVQESKDCLKSGMLRDFDQVEEMLIENGCFPQNCQNLWYL